MSYSEYSTNKQFCPIPWTSVYIWPGGEVENCCQSENKLGNIQNSTIDEILNSPKVIKIKSDMLNGIAPAGCKKCYPSASSYDKEDFNYNITARAHYLNDFQEFDKTLYVDPNNFEYRYADLRFRNTCNFACVYCGPQCSSSWSSELNLIHKISDEKINHTYDYFLKNIHNLKIVYLAGGEPLLIKENLALLEELYKVNPNCSIRVNTNLSIIKNNQIFNQLIKFKNCSWRISAEDTHEKFEYIRYGGNWDTFYKNVVFLKSITDHISFTGVYTALNAKSMFNFVKVLEDIGFRKDQFDAYFVNGGHYLDNGMSVDPRLLPDEYLKDVINTIESELSGIERYDNNLQFILKCLKNNIPNKDSKKLFSFMETLDQRRNLDSRKVFPDIYEYCN